MEDRIIVDDDGRRILAPEITTHRCQAAAKVEPIDDHHICDASYPKMKLHSIVFNCASAKCKVCLDLNWECFPFAFFGTDLDSNTTLADEDETRRIYTTVHIIELSQESCLSCKVLYLAIKHSSQWYLERGNGPVDTSDFSVRITLSPGFTVNIEASNLRGDFLSPVELFTKPGHPSPWKAIGPARHRSLDPDTHARLNSIVKFIRRHFARCPSHLSCIQETPELPTRIIDLHELTKLRLVSSNGKRARYLALSHCWGSKEYNPLKTTKSSLEEYHTAIPWGSLSVTFQHAILITWKLGYHFLWIDSLCIVQDDPLDWEIESMKMAEIYTNSEITLSATSSEDGRNGLIFGTPDLLRESHLVPQDNVEHEYPSELENIFLRHPATLSHEIVDVLPALMGDRDNSAGNVQHETAPLTERAWAFQESVLPRRSVLFHNQELIWECRHLITCECGRLSWLDTKRSELKEVSPSLIRKFPLLGWKAPFVSLAIPWEIPKENVAIQWYKIVLAYSALYITYESDRLPALSGLAKLFSRNLESKYLAGLWECDLWRGLLWMRPESCGRITRCRRLTNEASSIPTWSWASIIRDEHENASIYDFAAKVFGGLEMDARFAVISANCSLSSANMFGHVKGGVLKLRGALIETLVSLVSRESLGLNLEDYELLLLSPHREGDAEFYPAYSPNLYHHLVFDVGFGGVPTEVRLYDTVHCLCVASAWGFKGTIWAKSEYCLVLKELRKDTYQRVGILRYALLGIEEHKDKTWNFSTEVPFKSWFEDAPITEVNIV